MFKFILILKNLLMKKHLLILIILFTFINLKAQHPDKIIIFLLTDFETNYPDHGLGGWLTDSINPWVIDDDNPENIWQIGKPYKTAFDTAYTVPNSIITDTINSYPPNNHSSFQFLITKSEWAKNRCISTLFLYFNHKYETDTLYDGGVIDISYDNEENWINVLNDDNVDDIFFQNFYGIGDTINNGEFAFSGEYLNNWNNSGIEWYWNDDKASNLDSITIRFNFISDGIDNNKAGWMIDNIYFLIEDYCTIGINDVENKSGTFIYPNPVTGISLLELPENDTDYYIQIYNLKGVEVFNCITKNNIEINRNDFNHGIYIYKISNSKNKIYTGKFIVK